MNPCLLASYITWLSGTRDHPIDGRSLERLSQREVHIDHACHSEILLGQAEIKARNYGVILVSHPPFRVLLIQL